MTSGANCAYGIFRKDTSSITGIGIRDGQENNWVVLGRMYWNRTEDHFEVITSQAGTVFKSGCIFLEDDLVLVWIVFTALNPGNTRIFYIYPGMAGGGTSSFVYHAQLEETAWFTSPIVTNTVPVTRLGDSFLSEAPYELGDDSTGTFYIKFAYPMGYSLGTANMVYHEYDNSNIAESRIIFYASSSETNRIVFYLRTDAGVQTYSSDIVADSIESNTVIASFNENTINLVFNDDSKQWNNTLGLPIGIDTFNISSSVSPVARPLWLAVLYRDKIYREGQTLASFVPPNDPS